MFNTGCNIYSIAKNTFLLEDHITNVDPNPDRDLWFFSQSLLDFHCTTCGFESALEAFRRTLKVLPHSKSTALYIKVLERALARKRKKI